MASDGVVKTTQLDFQGYGAIRFRPDISPDPLSPFLGQLRTLDDGHTAVWNGTEWQTYATSQDVAAAIQEAVAGGGGASLRVIEYRMPTPGTTADVNHQFGHDPVVIQVFDESGVLCEGYGVSFTVPNETVRVSFDVSIAALIRLA